MSPKVTDVDRVRPSVISVAEACNNLLVYLTICVEELALLHWKVGGARGELTLLEERTMEGPPMTFVFHHGGKFKKDEGGNLYYEPDHTEMLKGVDSDTLDVFFVNGYFKELGYAEARECWWKSLGVPLESGLRRLATDHDLIAMVKDCRRNFNLINMYFDVQSHLWLMSRKKMCKKLSHPKPRNITLNPPSYHPTQKHALNPRRPQLIVADYPLSPQSCLLSPLSCLPNPTKVPSQPTKLHTQPTKQPLQPTKEPTKPTGPSSKPTVPSSKPTRPSFQPTKKLYHLVETPSQPKKPYSQPTKPTPAPPQTKAKTKVTTTTRARRHVKTLEVEEDSDSHYSYESDEDSLYKSPKVLGDDEYSSDSDDGVNSTKVNKKSESYEASDDDDDCDSDLEDNDVDYGDKDLKSWHSEDSGQELDSDGESPTVYPQYNDKAKFGDLKAD
ncbi:hypothetical protein Ahy_B05g075908 [Arachis hypogaea]|uniref:PB1-like domain-containing protein n=1 Tax=Arachis hypogaea TaxID=3818 RepID=A0A444Z275_ARAHY|nr:hypothetical protein Ahy_B05g075908 [Arachis hypogaea]